jgi:hypothetical protein
MVIEMHKFVSKVEERTPAVVFAHEWDSFLQELPDKKERCTCPDCAVRKAEKCLANLNLPPSDALKAVLEIVQPGKNFCVGRWVYYIMQDYFANRIETVSQDWKLFTAIYYRHLQPICMLPVATWNYPMNYEDVITDMQLIDARLNRMLAELLVG